MGSLEVVRERDVAADLAAVESRVGGDDALSGWYTPSVPLPAGTQVVAGLVPLPGGSTRVRLTARQPLRGLGDRLRRRRREAQLAQVIEEALRALDAQLRDRA